MTQHRPNPEQLLKRVEDEIRKTERGKLKIYLGAAPGVGKTYEMLDDALQERQKGLDVVAGIIESHGRHEIEAMLQNIEILPRQMVDYHGQKLLEFDLDAALKRSPALILMDEMAHTNAPGLRHEKRWQDIKELLDRGINVNTTLNVQHIESLNDDVAKIIHAPIKETVPDFMIEMVDTIELVDLPPDDLLKRLKEGKIYIPKQAKLASEHFFRRGNLIALRELALRTVAERVGAEVLLHRQGEGIKPIWPIKDKILVCVGPDAESKKLIRTAKRMANNLQAEWLAVYIDVPQLKEVEKKRHNAISNLRFAEQLGAETRVLAGFDIAKEIISFAHDQNVTQIIIWKHIHKRWQDWLWRNVSDELVRLSGDIDIYIVTSERQETLLLPKHALEDEKPTHWPLYGLAFGIVIAATFIIFFSNLTFTNLLMVYLLALTIIALFGQLRSTLLASLLSISLLDLFFLPPFYHFSMPSVANLINFFVMLVIPQIICYLTLRIRHQAESARVIQHQTSALYALSRQLSKTRGKRQLLEVGIHFIAKNFNSQVHAFLPKNHMLTCYDDPSYQLEEKEYSIAQWVYELGEMAGFCTDTLAFSDAIYMPMIASQEPIGVLRIMPNTHQLFTPEQLRLIEACNNQISLALEVDKLHDNKH